MLNCPQERRRVMPYIMISALKHPGHLSDNLRKYARRGTPDYLLKKGEFWGKGQIEISPSPNETWCGQIRSCSTRLTEQGLEVALDLFWYAKKVTTRKTTNFLMIPWTTVTWSEWVELRSPYKTTFVISKFSQNKDRRRKGVRYPKRLFFVTTTKEKGFFTRRNDPRNLNWKKGRLFDPVLKKCFSCKPIAS